jgi:hypothetical protein
MNSRTTPDGRRDGAHRWRQDRSSAQRVDVERPASLPKIVNDAVQSFTRAPRRVKVAQLTPTHSLSVSSRCHVARTSERTEAVEGGFWIPVFGWRPSPQSRTR